VIIFIFLNYFIKPKMYMTIVYESNLSKEFLRIILDYIKEGLRLLLNNSHTGTLKLLPKWHRDILKFIFPSEMKKIEDATRRVVQEVDEEIFKYKEYMVNALLKMLEEIQKRREEEGSAVSQAYSESAVQPFYRALEAMMRMHVEIADVFSSRSFMAAFLTLSLLDRKLQRLWEDKISVKINREGGIPIIHSTWSRLAEKEICLICKPKCAELDIEETCKALERVGRNISTKEDLLNKIHDGMVDYERGGRSKLSKITYNELNPVEQNKGVKELLCEYIIEHLCALREQKQPNELLIEDIKTYINKVFVNRSFLEYEVYSALVRQGIAAIPQLHFSIRDAQLETSPYEAEVDVVATTNAKLCLLEVTTLGDEKNIEEKIKKYEWLKNFIEADKVIFVISQAMKSVKDVFSSHQPEFSCMEFNELYSGIHKLLTN